MRPSAAPVWAATVMLLGCSSSSASSSTATCTDASNAASKRVVLVAVANLDCSADADCVNVPLHASCFDMCSRNVNQTGKGAIDRAQSLVEAGECKQFSRAACSVPTSIPGACPPAPPPHCNHGKCE